MGRLSRWDFSRSAARLDRIDCGKLLRNCVSDCCSSPAENTWVLRNQRKQLLYLVVLPRSLLKAHRGEGGKGNAQWKTADNFGSEVCDHVRLQSILKPHVVFVEAGAWFLVFSRMANRDAGHRDYLIL
jgi:hypothetical protein